MNISVSNNSLRTDLAEHVHELPAAWREQLAGVLHSQSWLELTGFLQERLLAGATIYPARPLRALELTLPAAVSVVILGQDPYHGAGQAQGLAFSVPTPMRRPPSLRNIFIEVAQNCGGNAANFNNDLTRWAQQGVLLLNALLTVEDGQPASHAKKGWETFTDSVIASVANHPAPKAFLLWGAHAQSKRRLIPADSPHLVLTANHPSPLSALRPPKPFLGCEHFVRTNQWLTEQGRAPIDWADAPGQPI